MQHNPQTCHTNPLDRPDPLTVPGPIRVLLSRAASDLLTASGERAFSIVHQVMRGAEEPQTMGRWEITLSPIDWQAARDAASVLVGTASAKRVRSPQKPSYKE